jgi:hypothetical protein
MDLQKVNKYFLLTALIVSNPTSIHWSCQGNYLVDQNGKRTEIQGNPKMVCHQGLGDVYGTFQKARGQKIWLINASRYIEIDKPVCDIDK